MFLTREEKDFVNFIDSATYDAFMYCVQLKKYILTDYQHYANIEKLKEEYLSKIGKTSHNIDYQDYRDLEKIEKQYHADYISKLKKMLADHKLKVQHFRQDYKVLLERISNNPKSLAKVDKLFKKGLENGENNVFKKLIYEDAPHYRAFHTFDIIATHSANARKILKDMFYDESPIKVKEQIINFWELIEKRKIFKSGKINL